MNPKISLVIPVYNVELYLKDCIESILNQTYKEFEIVLINDGSVDLSGEICDNFSKQDKRVRVIHQENKGPSFTRNLGITLAKGKYIGFIDSDDTIDKFMLEKMYNTIEQFKSDIVMCGFTEINLLNGTKHEASSPLGGTVLISDENIKKKFEEYLNKRTFLGYASMCNKFYKKDFLINNQIRLKENIKIAEDMCFNIEAILTTKKISAINESLYNYRRINSESIMNKKESHFYLKLESRNQLMNILKSNNITGKVYFNYLKYENSNTISEYIDEIIKEIKKRIPLNIKIKRIKKLIREEYLKLSLKNFDKGYFVLKANLTIQMIKIIVCFDELFRKTFKIFNMRLSQNE